MKKILIMGGVLVLGWMGAFAGVEAAPRTFHYEGRLLNDQRNPVPDGTYPVAFRVHGSAEGGGDVLWQWRTSMTTVNGEFEATLGAASGRPLPDSENLWLGVAVDGEAEMRPRLPLPGSRHARPVYSEYYGNGALGDWTPIEGHYYYVLKHANRVSDERNIYDAGTGQFTLPESGRYLLNIALTTDVADESFVTLQINGGKTVGGLDKRLMHTTVSSPNIGTCGSLVFEGRAGDRVRLVYAPGASDTGGSRLYYFAAGESINREINYVSLTKISD